MNTEILLVPLLMGLMQAIKQIPWLKAESHAWILPFLAIGIGVVGTMGALSMWDGPTAIKGIIYGLAAVGLYQATVDPAKHLIDGKIP